MKYIVPHTLIPLLLCCLHAVVTIARALPTDVFKGQEVCWTRFSCLMKRSNHSINLGQRRYRSSNWSCVRVSISILHY
ncbi:hypothetical protein BJ165DRAFT_914585 [Panaeolus papilionaceus]|nr:hypothetical protein BJ165DRAFT_914585 [Panaeolus papilionaceus]